MDASPAPLLRALAHVAATADGLGVAWALTGSCGLALRGADVRPDDIDVRVGADDAARVLAALRGEVVEHVSTDRPAARARSHHGRVRVHGWLVDLIGGLHLRAGEALPWRPAPGDVRATRRRLVGHELHVPLLDLADEAAVYGLLGRPERVAQVSALARAGG